MSMTVVVTEDPAAEAAALIGESLYSALAAQGFATLALSGGSTPAPMLAALAEADLDWPLITVLQVDERVVPAGWVDRNLTMIVDTLARLERPPAVEPIRVELGAEAAAAHYSRRVDKLLAGRPIDVVHLGLGADGHTASLFPGEWAALPAGSAAATAEHGGPRRVTLATRQLALARSRVVLATGADKGEALARVRAGDPALPWSLLPHEGTTWFVDPALDEASRR